MCRIRVGQGYLRVGNKDFKKGGGAVGKLGQGVGAFKRGALTPLRTMVKQESMEKMFEFNFYNIV